MIVLSLFDGMSCGQIALERAGIPVEKYYASEIDKHAIKVTMANYPNTIQIGDVRNIDINNFDIPDILIGGSPCQSFSFAGLKKGMSTKCQIEILTLEQYLKLKKDNFEFEGQSYLFWEYVRILTSIRERNPKVKFLLENVQMEDKWKKVLSRSIGVNPIEINSALVSAQNRVRLYWTNINEKPYGFFGDMFTDIPQPKDKKIFLKDIIQSDVDSKYYLNESILSKIEITENNIKQDISCFSLRGRTSIAGKRKDYKGAPYKQRFEENKEGKTNCLTSVQKDNLVRTLNPTTNGKQTQQQNRVYDINFKNPALLSQLGGRVNIIENKKYRRLTEIEYERLQNVPDNYTNHVSSTQRYKMLGNGWNVDTIVHIFNYLK